MLEMKSSLKFSSLLGASGLVLAACGGGGGSAFNPTPSPTVVVSTVPGQIGAGFEQVFNKDANSDATDPVPDNTVSAVSFTDDPIPVP
jgi:hypothetical protein